MIHGTSATLLGVMLALGLCGTLRAQCPDGTPPPCEVRERRLAARVTPPPPRERGRSFLVLPFRNITRSPTHDWLVEGSVTFLADALARWREVSVVPLERLRPALRRSQLTPGDVMEEDRVRRVAEETRGWTVVTGEVVATGSRVRFRARAYDVITNRDLVRAAEDVDADADVLSAYERLAGQLLQAAGLEARTPDPATARTQSLDAYKAYLRGLAHYDRAEYLSAQNAFLEAVRFDSAFAQAYAKLASASITSLEALLDPRSPVYRHARRAAELAERLPRRDRELVQASNALMHGQFAVAREALERLVAADSNDVEALELLAFLEQWDMRLVTVAGVEHRRGSLHQAARLAKRALDLDRARHRSYQTLVEVYALAGGWVPGILVGYRQEAASFAALLLSPPDGFFRALLKDSLEVVAVPSVESLSRDSLAAALERAQAVAGAWVSRWLQAAPTEARAHFMASVIYDLRDRPERALAELIQADSLGLQSEWLENPVGRRMSVLARLRRFAAAQRIADSLLAVGYFGRELHPAQNNHAKWAFLVSLITGDLARAETLADRQRAAWSKWITDGTAGRHAVQLLVSPDVDFLGWYPEALRLEALDSLFAKLERAPENGLIVTHVPDLLSAAAAQAPWTRGTEARTRLVSSVHRAAARLAESGRTNVAALLATILIGLDATETRRLRVLATLKRITQVDSANALAHYQIGRIAALTGRDLEAGEAGLKRYLQGEPLPDISHGAAHWRLGMIYDRRGARDLAQAEYQRALELDPRLASALAAVYEPARAALPRVPIASDVLTSYVGEYQLSPAVILTIAREADSLYVHNAGQPKRLLLPTTETTFAILGLADAQFTFVRDRSGRVTALLLQQGGREATAPKVK